MCEFIARAAERSPPLEAFLESAGVDKSSVIRVTGPSALSALLWLCRHGYDRVAYVRAAEASPHEDSADAILVAHTCRDLDVTRMLSVARQARPGGVFIFRLRTGPGRSAVDLTATLRQCGFTLERRLEGRRRALIVARREASIARRAA